LTRWQHRNSAERRRAEAGIAALFVASLGLLMTDAVELRNVTIVADPHKGTRGGPADRGDSRPAPGGQLAELSHVIRAGMITYPGLPGPAITAHLTREASRAQYAPGTEFAIDQLTMAGNTGTCLDAPYHRFPAARTWLPFRWPAPPSSRRRLSGSPARGSGGSAWAP
jgi:hypothetical protein